MCELCEKIWDSIEDYKDGKYSWDEIDVIYRNGECTYLYLPCDDYYYTRSMRIDYCPICGRKLKEESTWI